MNLYEDVAAVMRVLESALTLNDVEMFSQASLYKENARIDKPKARNEKLKNYLLDYQSKYEI